MQLKKLALNKETLTSLDQVNGGVADIPTRGNCTAGCTDGWICVGATLLSVSACTKSYHCTQA